MLSCDNSYQLYMGDCHVHPTPRRHSNLRKLLHTAREHQMDFLGVTRRHPRESEIYGENQEILGLLEGTEIPCQGAVGLHIVVYGGAIYRGKVHLHDLGEYTQEWSRKGAVSILVHPWTIYRDHHPERIFKMLDRIVLDGGIHAVELINGGFSSDSMNGWEEIAERYARLWMPLGMGTTGGSDWHQVGYGGHLGSGQTYLWTQRNDQESWLKALRHGHSAAALGRISVTKRTGITKRLNYLRSYWPKLIWNDVIGPPEMVSIIADQGRKAETELKRSSANKQRVQANSAFSAGNYRLAISYLSGNKSDCDI